LRGISVCFTYVTYCIGDLFLGKSIKS